MNQDIEKHVKDGFTWQKLPERVKLACGNSEQEYNHALIEFSIKHQVRYRGSSIRHVIKNEKAYYERLLEYSKKNLMLYPYHLQERMIGLRVTSFSYYISMMEDLMKEERSYDSLPNFTAADGLRLLGIGRNQFIELMNNCRSTKKFSFRRKPQIRDFLPKTPVAVNIEPWWTVRVGFITEDDIKLCTSDLKSCIDRLIDEGPLVTCTIDREMLKKLYTRGLVMLDVPIKDDTKVIVPPLEGFVMNRVLGDYFETLLYKIFVSIDEHTTMTELSTVLDISLELVKNAVSVFCRLGFARLKEHFDVNSQQKAHKSWKESKSRHASNNSGTSSSLLHFGSSLLDLDFFDDKEPESIPGISRSSIRDYDSQNHDSGDISMDIIGKDEKGDAWSMTSQTSSSSLPRSCRSGKRIAFLFDSSLTAFLMMGNLSPGLKNHAVTLFEVGKLTDESVSNFVNELYKVKTLEEDEGEAKRYFDHAITLRTTIEFLRHNTKLTETFCDSDDLAKSDEEQTQDTFGIGLDLIRCESLSGLDPKTAARLINKNYHVVVAMAPLNDEIITNLTHRQILSGDNQSRIKNSVIAHWFGPSCATINSVWFKLYIYHMTGNGPPTLLLCRGTKLPCLPDVFENYDDLLITSIGHDPCIVVTSNVVMMLNEALTHSPVVIQGFSYKGLKGRKIHIPFPLENLPDLSKEVTLGGGDGVQQIQTETEKSILLESELMKKVSSVINLKHSCGYLTFLRSTRDEDAGELEDQEDICKRESTDEDYEWQLLSINFGIPLFDKSLNHDVCDRLVSQNLCDVSNLAALRESNIKLAENISKFIDDYQDSTYTFDSFHIDQKVPYPSENLFFSDGFLSTWDG